MHQGLSAEASAAQVRDMVLAFLAAWVPAAALDEYGDDRPADRSTSTTTHQPTAGPQG